jgi:hypothetical protein
MFVLERTCLYACRPLGLSRKVQSSPWAKMFQNIAARGLRPVEFESDEDSLFDYLCYLSFQVSQLDPQGI